MSMEDRQDAAGARAAASAATPEAPFVSVIIPVYNDLERLKRCLAGVAAQTYPWDRFEVIVVDNGSREPLVDQLGGPFHVRVLREDRSGSYAARNAGIRAANGDVLAFTDADCIPTPEWLERGVERLMDVPECGLVAGRLEVFVRHSASRTPTETYEVAVGFPQERYATRGRYGATANMLTTRAVLRRVGPFDEDLFSGGDRAWGNAVFDAGYRVEYCAEAVVRHPARRSLGEMRRKMRRVAFGNHALARLERPIRPRSLFLRLLAPPVQHLADIWTNGVLIRPDEKLRASLVALYTKYVWTAYRVYFALGGRLDEERVRGDWIGADRRTIRASRLP